MIMYENDHRPQYLTEDGIVNQSLQPTVTEDDRRWPTEQDDDLIGSYVKYR